MPFLGSQRCLLGGLPSLSSLLQLPNIQLLLDSRSGVYADGATHFVGGSSQTLTIADNASLSMGAGVRCTITGWVKFTAAGQAIFLSKYNSTGSQQEYVVQKTGANLLQFLVNDTGAAAHDFTATANTFGTLSTATWYFFCAYYDGVNIGISVNNGAFDTTAYSADIFNGTATFFLGGLQGPVVFFSGDLDSIGIWKRVLTASEITDLYNAGSGRVYADLMTISVKGAAGFKAASSQYLNRAAQTWGVGNAWSVAGWVNPTAVVGQNWFQLGSNVAAPTSSVFKFRTDYVLVYDSTGVAYKLLNRAAAIPIGWMFVVVKWDGASLTIYENAVDVTSSYTDASSGVFGSMANASRPLFLGCANNASPTEFFGGSLDSVAIYAKALSAGEITSLYNSGAGLAYSGLSGSLLTSLVSWWDLKEVSGNRTDSVGSNTLTSNAGVSSAVGISVDSTQSETASIVSWWDLDEISGVRYDAVRASANDLTANNAPTQTGGIVAGLATDVNFAAQFTAANSEYLSVASNSSLQTGSNSFFSIAFWVYFDSIGALENLVGKDAGGANREYFIRLNADNSLTFTVSNDGASLVATATYSGATAGAWLFVVAWYDGVNINLSVNNGTTNTAAFSSGVFAGTADFILGSFNGGGRFLDGRMDAVGLWKGTVLAAAERTALFNAGKGLKYAGLAAAGITTPTSFWNLDEASGTRSDSVGTNHLTDNNTVTQAQGVNYIYGEVSAWLDQTLNANHARQATVSKRGLYRSNIIGGYPTIRLDGVDDWYALTNHLNYTSLTIFVVYAARVSQTVRILVSDLNNAATNGWAFGISDSAADKNKLFTANTTQTNLDATSAMTVGTFALATAVFDASGARTKTIYKNGVLNGTNTGDTTPGTTGGTASIGTYGVNAAGTQFFDGDIALIAVCNSALSDTLRAQAESYIMRLYGIT